LRHKRCSFAYIPLATSGALAVPLVVLPNYVEILCQAMAFLMLSSILSLKKGQQVSLVLTLLGLAAIPFWFIDKTVFSFVIVLVYVFTTCILFKSLECLYSMVSLPLFVAFNSTYVALALVIGITAVLTLTLYLKTKSPHIYSLLLLDLLFIFLKKNLWGPVIVGMLLLIIYISISWPENCPFRVERDLAKVGISISLISLPLLTLGGVRDFMLSLWEVGFLIGLSGIMAPKFIDQERSIKYN
jgi:hypothetical protein